MKSNAGSAAKGERLFQASGIRRGGIREKGGFSRGAIGGRALDCYRGVFHGVPVGIRRIKRAGRGLTRHVDSKRAGQSGRHQKQKDLHARTRAGFELQEDDM